jgi:hypothetical protein
MAEKIQIKAVEMVRHIRDEQAKMLAGKTKAEIMAFFNKAGETARQEAKQRRSTQQQPRKTGQPTTQPDGANTRAT